MSKEVKDEIKDEVKEETKEEISEEVKEDKVEDKKKSVEENVADNKKNIDENKKSIDANRELINSNNELIKTNRKLIYVMYGIMIAIWIGSVITTIYFMTKYNHINKVVNDRGKGTIESNIIVGEDAGGNAGLAYASTEESLPIDPEGSKADAIAGKDQSSADANKYMIHFTVGGYRFYVPNEYECMAVENVGVIIYKADSFQMKIVVKGRPYDEVVNDEASMKKAAEAAGAELTSEITDATVNNNKYTFFRCNINGDEHFVIYGSTPDGKSHTGGQIEIFDKKLSDEDLLNIFNSVAENAEVDESVVAAKDDKDPARLDTSSIEFGDTTVKYNVPAGLYYSDTITHDNNVVETFWDETTFVEVNLTDNTDYEGPKSYVEADGASTMGDDEEVLTEKVGDNKVYYYINSSKGSSGGNNQHIYAACSIGDDIFHVAYTVYESDEELTFDDVKEFFEFTN